MDKDIVTIGDMKRKSILNMEKLVKYPLVTENIRGYLELPEKLSEQDINRIIPLLEKILESHLMNK